MQVTLQHLDNLLSKPAFTRPCKLSYQQLLEMKRTADFHWDAYWELEMYDQCIRYTKISQRIIEAMLRHPNKFINETKNR
jgi:hypothetical protein